MPVQKGPERNYTKANHRRRPIDEIALRPISRIGDLLETIPGMVATQHSGNGKANQYFLRGFNLDHGNVDACLAGSSTVAVLHGVS